MRSSFVFAFSILLCISPLAKAEPSAVPGDLFVDAYVTAQRAEKEEQAGNLNVALSKLRAAIRMLDRIGTEFPQWSPTILRYRKERTAAAIARVREKIGQEKPVLPVPPQAPESPTLSSKPDDSIPRNWRAFKFNGLNYYVAPLNFQF